MEALSRRLFLVAVLCVACGSRTSADVGEDGGGETGGDGVVDAAVGDAETEARSDAASHAGDDSGATTADSGMAIGEGAVVVHDAAVDAHAGGDGGTVTCSPGAGGISGTPISCQSFVSETCSDGNSYSVECDCPQGTCQCTGSSGGGITITTCPTCPFWPQSLELCGFPH